VNASTVLLLVVLACVLYLVVTTLIALAFVVIGAVENAMRKMEGETTDYEILASSRFTVPVSVIVAAFNEERVIESTIRSLLEFDYPEFEVILVNDGSTDDTLARVRDAFELEPYHVFVRHVLDTEEVRAVYRSAVHRNLVVVDKANGGKADSWNAGLNVARYRYVCGVDADTVFDRKALLKVMRVAIQDPARIVGVTSQISTARSPETAIAAAPGQRAIEPGPLAVYQHLDFLRAFVNNRLAWSRHRFMLCSPGGFQIWRRDVLQEVGGYSTAFTCEDIELTFRVHERFLREGRDYRIHCLPDSIGVTESPDTYRKLVAQRERWQRVIDETVVHYRRMWFNPRYKAVGLVGTPFYLISEVISPAIEVLALGALVAAVALGLFSATTFFAFFAAMAFSNAALTAAAILLDDLQSRLYRKRDLTRLLLYAPLDLVLYRPIMFWARLKGSWRFLRGDKGWYKFERNVRTAS
jgi:cellulose synthase/poly-beta-1,6-N-acetylglucosamine synthase-like glycosyltransferase